MTVSVNIGKLALVVAMLMAWAAVSWACGVDMAIGEQRIGCSPREPAEGGEP